MEYRGRRAPSDREFNMQATKFDPLTRVLVERTDGSLDSWVVLHYLDGRVIVGCETEEGELTKAVPPRILAAWQEQHAGQDHRIRPASLSQLEVAHRWAVSYAKDDEAYGKG